MRKKHPDYTEFQRNGSTGINSPRSRGGGKRTVYGKPSISSEAALTPNPTLKVLSSMRSHGVQSLLMGGQACVFYGAAEFSRDADFAVYAEKANLERFQRCMESLRGEVIAVPPFERRYLDQGLAVHFRCQAEEVEGFRVDVMTKMRGVDPFPDLWKRRTTISVEGVELDLMSLPDLIQAKKTQRSKDWPMIQRLVEANWFQNRHEPNPARIDFWLRECRTSNILMELAERFKENAVEIAPARQVVHCALTGNKESLQRALEEERRVQMDDDKAYWAPLRKEIERIRLKR